MIGKSIESSDVLKTHLEGGSSGSLASIGFQVYQRRCSRTLVNPSIRLFLLEFHHSPLLRRPKLLDRRHVSLRVRGNRRVFGAISAYYRRFGLLCIQQVPLVWCLLLSKADI